MLLDTAHNVATPEGVELRLPLAGLGSRAIAWLVDAAIKFFALSVTSMLLAYLSEFGIGIYLICVFLLLWFYNVLFEVLAQGATPGKKALGLRVMNRNGTPVGWNGSLIRNLLRFVDSLPGCYLFGCLAVLMSRDFQRLGDLAAGTVVVYEEKMAATKPFTGVMPQPLNVPLTLDEQQAIVSFGERAPRLNSERADELASILTPLLGETDGSRLRAHAAWLAGGSGEQ